MQKSRLFPALVLVALMAPGFAQTAPVTISIPGIPGISQDFIRGADISSLAQIEEVGGKFYDADGKAGDLLRILKNHGVNWIRLRLWNNPVNEQVVLEGDKVISNKGQRVGGGNNDLERTVGLAKRAKAMGFKLLLDFHYSDFWADPRTQKKPAAWKGLNQDQLAAAVHDYTAMVLRRLVREGARPDMVQLGNETNGGMLWPEGKTWQADATEKIGGFPAFIRFLGEGARAVRESDPVKSGAGKIRIAIHLADGGDNNLYRFVFDKLTAAKLDFDIIGLSYYPYWHGELKGLAANLADIVPRYGKAVVVMETAYAFTTEDGDGTGNSFQVFNGESGGYLPTVQGQATVVRDVMATVAAAPQGKGLGVFYWEPAWIPVVGAGWRTGEGDSWENQAMFDFSGKALASLDVFKRVLDQAAAPTAMPRQTETSTLRVAIGDPLNLPARVKTIFSDDSWRWMDVVWDKVDFSPPKSNQTIQFKGALVGAGLPVLAAVEFTTKRNLIPDPSFESGKLDGWTLDDPAKASRAENNAANAFTGSWTYKYWLDKAFSANLSRTFTDLPNGTYELTCQAAGGGGEKSIKLLARDFGGTAELSTPIVNTGWKKWKQYLVSGIKVVNHQCTIGLAIDAQAGNWGNFDDMEFYKVSD